MRHTCGAVLLLALAACNATPQENPPLPGEWVMMADTLNFPAACGTHGPVTYHEDGTFTLWGQHGTWQMDGKQLTETVIQFDPLHVDVEPGTLGKPFISTLQWVDGNSFVKHYSDGEVRAFRRCPDQR